MLQERLRDYPIQKFLQFADFAPTRLLKLRLRATTLLLAPSTERE
jgi:hypothetical protein